MSYGISVFDENENLKFSSEFHLYRKIETDIVPQLLLQSSNQNLYGYPNAGLYSFAVAKTSVPHRVYREYFSGLGYCLVVSGLTSANYQGTRMDIFGTLDIGTVPGGYGIEVFDSVGRRTLDSGTPLMDFIRHGVLTTAKGVEWNGVTVDSSHRVLFSPVGIYQEIKTEHRPNNPSYDITRQILFRTVGNSYQVRYRVWDNIQPGSPPRTPEFQSIEVPYVVVSI